MTMHKILHLISYLFVFLLIVITCVSDEYANFPVSTSPKVEYSDKFERFYVNEKDEVIGIEKPHATGYPSEFTRSVQAEENLPLVYPKSKYSYKYLEDIMDLLCKEWEENMENPNSIWTQVTCMGIGDDCIQVDILHIDDTKIEEFKTEISGICDFDVFVFENSDRFFEFM